MIDSLLNKQFRQFFGLSNSRNVKVVTFEFITGVFTKLHRSFQSGRKSPNRSNLHRLFCNYILPMESLCDNQLLSPYTFPIKKRSISNMIIAHHLFTTWTVSIGVIIVRAVFPCFTFYF